jgi:hypothetical protein
MKSMEKQRQQRKAANSSKPIQVTWEAEGKLKTPSQEKPNGPGGWLTVHISPKVPQRLKPLWGLDKTGLIQYASLSIKFNMADLHSNHKAE